MSKTILHITDPEGDFSWIKLSIEQAQKNKVGLAYDGDTNLTLDPNTHIVFGGDLFGNGPENIKTINFVLALKAQYPNQIHINPGNREVIMTRIKQELRKATREFLTSEAGAAEPRWDGKAQRYTDYCTDKALDLTSEVSQLKWMLEKTMGSGKLLASLCTELGMDEVGVIKYLTGDEFQKSLYSLLNQASPLIRIGDTVFGHGAVVCPEKFHEGVDFAEGANSLLTAVNDDYHEAVRQSQQFSSEAPVIDSPICMGRLNLMALPSDFLEKGSVMTAQSQDKEGPCMLPETVVDMFTRSGVNRYVCGHKPWAPMPVYLSADSHGKHFEVLMNDSMYYRTTGTSSRLLSIHQTDHSSQAAITNVDKAGTLISSLYPTVDAKGHAPNIKECLYGKVEIEAGQFAFFSGKDADGMVVGFSLTDKGRYHETLKYPEMELAALKGASHRSPEQVLFAALEQHKHAATGVSADAIDKQQPKDDKSKLSPSLGAGTWV